MHILQAAARLADAKDRLQDVAEKLGKFYKLERRLIDALTVREKDPQVKAILVVEATADLLEAIYKTAKKDAEKDGKKDKKDKPDELRTDGPTLEEYINRGYRAKAYPPEGYAEVDSPGLQAYKETGKAPKKEKAPAEQETLTKTPPKEETPPEV